MSKTQLQPQSSHNQWNASACLKGHCFLVGTGNYRENRPQQNWNQQSMSNLVGGTYRDNGFAVTLEQFSLLALEIGVPGTWVSVLGGNFGVNGRAVTDLVKLESFLFVSRNFAEGEKVQGRKSLPTYPRYVDLFALRHFQRCQCSWSKAAPCTQNVNPLHCSRQLTF